MEITTESVAMLVNAYNFLNKVSTRGFSDTSNMANGLARLQTVLENIEKENKPPPEEGEKNKEE